MVPGSNPSKINGQLPTGSNVVHGSVAITAILMIALSAGFFGVVFGNRFGVQSPDAEAVLLLSLNVPLKSVLLAK
jgi:hypothetical protein